MRGQAGGVAETHRVLRPGGRLLCPTGFEAELVTFPVGADDLAEARRLAGEDGRTEQVTFLGSLSRVLGL